MDDKRTLNTTRLAFATVLLSGLLAALAAWGGSWIGSHGALSVQREQAQRPGRFAKHKVQLESLVGLLMEPAGRQVRQRAAKTICNAFR